MMRSPLLLTLPVLLAGCAGGTTHTSQTTPSAPSVRYDVDELVTIRGVIAVPETSRRDHAKIDVRYANGALAIRMTPDEDGAYGTSELFPGETYRVSAEFAMGAYGPWHFPTVVVEGGSGSVHELDFEPYTGSAGLNLTADEGTQRYLFALYPGDTAPPAGRGAFQKWFEEGIGHRTPLYMRMDDGAWSESVLPAGRYLAIVMPNDWAPGDRDAEPVHRVIELTSGNTARLHIGARCTALEER